MPRGPARKALAVAVALAFSHAAWGADVINAGGNAANLPTGGVPTNSANVTGSTLGASSLSVSISGRAVIDWSTFNIGSGNTVSFVGPGGAVLNRVPQGNAPGTGLANSSTIAGTLNGQNMLVMLMNPNGITFTSGAVVNVGALIATTGQIDENEYVNHGNAAISYPAGSPRTGIVNQGTITAEAAGLVALVAPSVANQGVISATGGKILLAGTDTATISMNGGLYEFAVGGSGGSVTNASGATLSGATLYLSTGDASNVLTSTINLSGIQQATGAIVVNGGTVALTSDLDAPVVGGNSTVANVQAGGGRIQDGVDIAMAGGTVNVGAGTWHEQLKITKSLALLGAGASQTFVTPTSLTADADGMGNILTIGGGPATNAEVSGFTFAGPVAGITSGIFVRDGAHASIHGNHVTDMRETATISGNQTGIGIFVGRAKIGTSGTADIENNVITGYQKGGIVVDGPGSSAAISGNTLVGEGPTTAIAQNGVQVSRGASATVTGNAISGNAYTGPRADPDDFAAGILFFNSSPYVGQGGLTVGSGNAVTANEVGVWTNDPIMLATTSLSGVSGNTRNAVAYFNGGYAGQGPLLEYPVWGAANAAFVNASAFSGAQSGDMVDTGGALRVYGWNGFTAIQPAVNAVAAAGTVNVAAGTYAESLALTKALTLKGAGAGSSIIDPVSGDALGISGSIGADKSIVIDGFTFRDAPRYGVNVAGTTVLGELTIRNSDFLRNGQNGFIFNGSRTNDAPGLAKVSLANDTFEGNGTATASSLGYGDILFNYFNRDATLRNLRITGDGEFIGIQMRGASPAANSPRAAGTVAFDNVTIEGRFLRPAGSAGTWNPGGPGDAIHLLEYSSVANVSFNNVVVTPSVGHGMFLEGLGTTLNLGNTTFGAPDTTITGGGAGPTRSWNIFDGSNDNGLLTNVNAAAATFLGAGSGFAIEDRVLHALDVLGLGLVTWNPGNVYVTNASGSIQRGVNAASVGDTVNVAGGTFAENVVVNGQRNLTFGGATMLGLTVNASGTGLGGTATANGGTGFVFNAPIVLTGNTSLTTTGANIAFSGDIQNGAGGSYALNLSAGAGNVVLTSGGTSGNPLGMLTVSSNNLSLSGTLWVSGYDIDALGAVALSNHTLRQIGGGASNTINAGGNVTGSTISEGDVAIQSDAAIAANVTASSIVIDAPQVDVTVSASNAVQIRADTSVNVAGSAPSLVLDAPAGSVGGSFGQVSNIGGGVVNVNGKPQVPDTLSVAADNSRMLPAEGTIGADAAGSKGQADFQRARAGLLVGEAEGTVGVVRSSPGHAADLLEGGFGVELDLAPGEERK